MSGRIWYEIQWPAKGEARLYAGSDGKRFEFMGVGSAPADLREARREESALALAELWGASPSARPPRGWRLVFSAPAEAFVPEPRSVQ